MSSVFLSYASQNEAYATAIERGLSGHGVTVWRDKTNLHAGERWPKRLGEAIAEKDFFLLLWSTSSAESDFVELEWTTAIALKKTVLLVLMDVTKLPASLAAIHGVGATQPSQAIQPLLSKLKQSPSEQDQERSQAVIGQLAGLSSVQPDEVLQQAKNVFQQSNWSVQGDVYQAGGDFHVTYNQHSTNVAEPWWKKWQAIIAILVGVLTAITLTIQLQQTFQDSAAVDPMVKKENHLVDQALTGSIVDDSGERISGVEVSLQFMDSRLLTSVTDELGQFSFHTSARPEEEVTVLARKDGYQTEKRYTHMRHVKNSVFNFKMRRKE